MQFVTWQAVHTVYQIRVGLLLSRLILEIKDEECFRKNEANLEFIFKIIKSFLVFDLF